LTEIKTVGLRVLKMWSKQ